SVKGETQLRNLSAKLGEAGVAHHLWIEQPEDVPSALAMVPMPRSASRAYTKKTRQY
ncbi:hypothetical protein KIPB_010073, partial [Kipferlia bialata]